VAPVADEVCVRFSWKSAALLAVAVMVFCERMRVLWEWLTGVVASRTDVAFWLIVASTFSVLFAPVWLVTNRCSFACNTFARLTMLPVVGAADRSALIVFDVPVWAISHR
jgi:hypothetical protein